MTFLESAKAEFLRYKSLGEKAMAQVPDPTFHWQPNAESNSIATIVKHLSGNMLSRWTDLLTTDGEKPWRNRDDEFEADDASREVVMKRWEEGWACLFTALDSLTEADIEKTVYIRGEAHTVGQAIHRQLAHYPSHVGQIVYLCRMLADDSWKSLSIPKNKSQEFNRTMFGGKQ